jgi:Cof subfamily protein (haloacid dehalogenase superfamily)
MREAGDRGSSLVAPRKYWMLGLDLDGTLLAESFEIESATADKLAALMSRGVEIVLCSGRRFSSAVRYARELGLTAPLVVNNGTIVKDIATGRTLYAEYFSPENATRLLRLLKEMNLPAVVLTDESGEHDYCVDVTDGGNEYHAEFVSLNREMAKVVDDLTGFHCDTISEINVFHEYETLLGAQARIRKAMDGRVHSIIIRRHVRYRGCTLETAVPGASKWSALLWIARQRGIKPEEIVAIGDEVNDIEMIREAGFGVAVANATDEVKAAADYVTKQPRSAGVDEAIDALFA